MCVCVCVWCVSLAPLLTPSNKTAQGMAIGASDKHSHKLILVFLNLARLQITHRVQQGNRKAP